jgi:flagellar motility protein MotE (MotC chaperone)
MKILIQPRLSPVLIFCASLLLTVKVAGVWQGVVVVTGAERANAQSAPQQAAPAAPPPKEAPPPGAAQATANPASEPPSGADLEVLQSLSMRRDQLDQRAAELDTREKLLMAAEERIKGRVEDLKKIEASINALIDQQTVKNRDEMAKLVKVYETMKPADAAKIFNNLDKPVLLNVVSMMNTGKVAPILAAMDAGHAKDLTVELATRKVVPDSAPEGLAGAPLASAAKSPMAGAAPPSSAPARAPGLLQPLPPGTVRPGTSG